MFVVLNKYDDYLNKSKIDRNNDMMQDAFILTMQLA